MSSEYDINPVSTPELLALMLQGGASAARINEVRNLLEAYRSTHHSMTANHKFSTYDLDAAGVLP